LQRLRAGIRGRIDPVEDLRYRCCEHRRRAAAAAECLYGHLAYGGNGRRSAHDPV